MSDSYCKNRHWDVSKHDSCMFVRKSALGAGKPSISCCIYSTAQPWLIPLLCCVSRICEIRNAAHCLGVHSRWRFNDINYTSPNLDSLDWNRNVLGAPETQVQSIRTVRSEVSVYTFWTITIHKTKQRHMKTMVFISYLSTAVLHLLGILVCRKAKEELNDCKGRVLLSVHKVSERRDIF